MRFDLLGSTVWYDRKIETIDAKAVEDILAEFGWSSPSARDAEPGAAADPARRGGLS